MCWVGLEKMVAWICFLISWYIIEWSQTKQNSYSCNSYWIWTNVETPKLQGSWNQTGLCRLCECCSWQIAYLGVLLQTLYFIHFLWFIFIFHHPVLSDTHKYDGKNLKHSWHCLDWITQIRMCEIMLHMEWWNTVP